MRESIIKLSLESSGRGNLGYNKLYSTVFDVSFGKQYKIEPLIPLLYMVFLVLNKVPVTRSSFIYESLSDIWVDDKTLHHANDIDQSLMILALGSLTIT